MSRETLSQSAYRRIREDIVEGRIPAESVLSERVLAEGLGISRTPLRTAISQLEKEGAVDRLSNGAILVRSVTVDQLIEIVKMRQQLESATAARAAQFPLTVELATIGEKMQHHAENDGVDFETFWRDDERFHIAVARAARFKILPTILTEHRAMARRCTLTRSYDSFTDQALEHIDIFEAIARGDADGAHAAMWQHFTNANSRFLNSFSDD